MRRRRKQSSVLPEELEHFLEADWPGRTWEDRYAFWRAARRLWAERGDGWPGGAVERILGEIDVRDVHHYGAPRRVLFSQEHSTPRSQT